MVNGPTDADEPLLPAARLRLGPLRQGDAVGLGRRLHRAGRHGRDLQRPQHLFRHPGPDLHPGALHDALADRRLLLLARTPRSAPRSTSAMPTRRSASSRHLLLQHPESADELLRAEDGGCRRPADEPAPRRLVAAESALVARRDLPDEDQQHLRRRHLCGSTSSRCRGSARRSTTRPRWTASPSRRRPASAPRSG